jgi:S-adenosylmethionine hydrolase
MANGEIMGQIDLIDEYGNAITNIHPDLFVELGIQLGQVIEVEFGNEQIIRCQYTTAYGDVPAGEPVGVFGSGGVFEVAINQGNLGDTLKLKASGNIVVRKIVK